MLLLTGAAGFVGSNLVARLNEAGRTDLILCDDLGSEGKWRNLNRPGFVGGSNFQIGWSRYEQDDEQILP